MAISQLERADIVVLVIDAERGRSEQDARLAGMIEEAGRGLVIELNKGDRVMVIEEAGWGRISDNMFIKGDRLSAKAIARNRHPAVWNPPSN